MLFRPTISITIICDKIVSFLNLRGHHIPIVLKKYMWRLWSHQNKLKRQQICSSNTEGFYLMLYFHVINLFFKCPAILGCLFGIIHFRVLWRTNFLCKHLSRESCTILYIKQSYYTDEMFTIRSLYKIWNVYEYQRKLQKEQKFRWCLHELLILKR